MQHPINESKRSAQEKEDTNTLNASSLIYLTQTTYEGITQNQGILLLMQQQTATSCAVTPFLQSTKPAPQKHIHPCSLNAMSSLPQGYGRHTSLPHGQSHSRVYHTKTLIVEAWRYTRGVESKALFVAWWLTTTPNHCFSAQKRD